MKHYPLRTRKISVYHVLYNNGKQTYGAISVIFQFRYFKVISYRKERNSFSIVSLQ